MNSEKPKSIDDLSEGAQYMHLLVIDYPGKMEKPDLVRELRIADYGGKNPDPKLIKSLKYANDCFDELMQSGLVQAQSTYRDGDKLYFAGPIYPNKS